MIKTESDDWRFIVIATLIWILALIASVCDFIVVQGMNHRFSLVNIVGLTIILIGISIRRIAKRILGRYYSMVLKSCTITRSSNTESTSISGIPAI